MTRAHQPAASFPRVERLPDEDMALPADRAGGLRPEPVPVSAVPALIPSAGVDDVLLEVVRATGKFPTWPTDPLHALAVLGEEYGELNKAVLQAVYEPHKSTLADVREEAIQCAAMAVRFLMSLPIYRYEECEQHLQAEYCDHCGASRDSSSPYCAPPFDVHLHEWTGKHPADKRRAAQAIEARRAETGTGSVHESAVSEGNAP